MAIAERTGARFDAAQSRLVLAVLDLEEGRAAQAEPVIRDALAFFRSEKMHDDQLHALVALARCLLVQGKMADAQFAIEQAQEISTRSQNPADRLRFEIAAARTKAADTGKAALSHRGDQSALRKCISTAHSLGFGLLEFEARLALGEVLTKTDSAGKEYLSSLQKEAHAHGFELISRKAARLL